METEKRYLSVSQVNRMARTVLEDIAVWVLGEVDDYEDQYRSATYFKLKDGESVLPCMFWKSSETITYFPRNGDKILLFGTLSLYEKTGKYQMLVFKIEAFGEGELLKQREELRKKLQSEGYFDESAKRPIPDLPQRIGLITSKRGAAIDDFKTNVVKNFEGLEIYFVDSLVQGEGAVKSICDALNTIAKYPLDVVVLTRGGGDIEDLMCFNSEEVVKAIRACPIPVISAVGHEVDYTLSDLASDLRVSTPTKAAEIISQSYLNFRSDLSSTILLAETAISRINQNYFFEMDTYEAVLKRTWSMFKELPEVFSDLKKRLVTSASKVFAVNGLALGASLQRIEALGPKNVLKRGYSISYLANGGVFRSVTQVDINDKLSVRVSDGQVITQVKEMKK